MEVNYITIVGAGVIAMALGFVWYGPLFGKKWMEVIGVSETDEAHKKEMQKEMMPTMVLQFLLVMLQAYVLAHFIKIWSGASGIETAIWVWLGFVVPTLASSVMWTAEKTSSKLTRFMLQTGYHLVLLIIFGYILQMWGVVV